MRTRISWSLVRRLDWLLLPLLLTLVLSIATYHHNLTAVQQPLVPTYWNGLRCLGDPIIFAQQQVTVADWPAFVQQYRPQAQQTLAVKFALIVGMTALVLRWRFCLLRGVILVVVLVLIGHTRADWQVRETLCQVSAPNRGLAPILGPPPARLVAQARRVRRPPGPHRRP